MKKLRIFSFLLITLLLVSCMGSKKKDTDDLKNTMPPTLNCVDGERGVFHSVYSPRTFFCANFFPRNNGAKGDGVSDDTAAIQSTIDKAAQSGGGVVYLDRGTYYITAPVIVGENVVLRGDFNSPSSKSVKNNDTVIKLGSFLDSAFVLKNNASLSDMIIYYENQSLTSALECEATVTSSQAVEISVGNLLILNATRGINLSDTLQKVKMENIYMSALSEGITLDFSGDIELYNINISPSYMISSTLVNPEKKINYSGAEEIINTNLKALNISARNIDISKLDIDAAESACSFTGKGSGKLSLSNFSITNSKTDLVVAGAFDKGSFFTSGSFGVFISEDSRNVVIADTYKNSAAFTQCSFSGKSESLISVDGDSRVTLNSCTFSDFKTVGIKINDGIVSVANSTVVPNLSFASLEDNTVGVFCSNNYFSKLIVSGGQVFSDNYMPSYPKNTITKSQLAKNEIFSSPSRIEIYKAKDYGNLNDNPETAIQKAADAAKIAGGGIVFVDAGVYTLNTKIVLQQGVRLIGAGNGSFCGNTFTELKTSATFSDDCIIELFKNSGVSGFIIDSDVDTNGILAHKSGVVVEKMKITGVTCGISFEEVNSALVSKNDITTIQQGVQLKNSNDIYINDNTFTGSVVGIDIFAGKDIKIFSDKFISVSSAVTVDSEKFSTIPESPNIVINEIRCENSIAGIQVLNCPYIVVINSQFPDVSLSEACMGEVFVFGSVMENSESLSGKLTLIGNLIDSVMVQGGIFTAVSNIFENKSVEAHIVANGGKSGMYCNVVITDVLFNGTNSGYLKKNIVENVEVMDYYNLKRVDYQLGDDL